MGGYFLKQTQNSLLFSITIFWVLEMIVGNSAFATETARILFCDQYSNSPFCVEGKKDCSVCHISPPSLNPYGKNIKSKISKEEFQNFLPDVLSDLKEIDSDNDGFSNEYEITRGYYPGNNTHFPQELSDTVIYDPVRALKRIKSIYCGKSSNYLEVKNLKENTNSNEYLHNILDECLQSSYWKKVALPRLADPLIKPLKSMGAEGSVVIADYSWDYRLFVHAMTDDRDARLLLSADYHIDEQGNKVDGKISKKGLPEIPQFSNRIVIGGGQPLKPEKRAGMITSQWFIAYFTMFATIPRATAAQAYRSYLGFEIGNAEGLFSTPTYEPQDLDSKGVKKPLCKSCHNTLDPLSYPFSAYRGIDPISALVLNNTGTFFNNPAVPESGFLLGSKVDDLLDWAKKARESDYFKKNLVKIIFKHALNQDPEKKDPEEFKTLWNNLASNNYSINQLIHEIVDLDAFGGN